MRCLCAGLPCSCKALSAKATFCSPCALLLNVLLMDYPLHEASVTRRWLALRRDKWLFRPAVPPSEMPPLPEAAQPSDVQPAPFDWVPAERSAHVFEMDDGIVRVWTDASRAEEAYAVPGTSYDFFSDLHRRAAAALLLFLLTFGGCLTLAKHVTFPLAVF